MAARCVCGWFAALAGAAAFALAAPAPTLAQSWPAKSVLVVSPFAPGTTNDVVAGLVLDQVSRQLGQSFALENRPGDNGSKGVVSVVKAAPDGYTFLLSSSALSAAVILHKSLPYDPVRDLAPVAMLGAQPSVLVTSPGKGYKSVADLVAAAKAKPGQLKFGSVGAGSPAHIVGERFRLAAGLDVQHVAYPSAVEALAALTAGDLDYYFLPLAPALPLVRQSKLTALAVSTSIATMPAVRTLAELGYLIDTDLLWDGLSAPAKTPPDIINKLNAAVVQTLNMPTIRNQLQRIGVQPVPMSPEHFGKFFADEIASMTKLAKDANIAPLD